MTAVAEPLARSDLPPEAVLDFERLKATPVSTDPFPHAIVPGFLKEGARASVGGDFPAIDRPGSFPLGDLSFGPAFQSLVDALHAPAFARIVEEKFGIDLQGRPTMITVRGMTQAKDGRIHTDSKTKLVTVLLYMNEDWEAEGGQLRLLRRPDDLDDMAAEVPPLAGTLLVFLNGPAAWHGHKPFVGRRRTIQLNWVTGEDVVRRERFRHGLSARLKRLNPFR